MSSPLVDDGSTATDGCSGVPMATAACADHACAHAVGTVRRLAVTCTIRSSVDALRASTSRTNDSFTGSRPSAGAARATRYRVSSRKATVPRAGGASTRTLCGRRVLRGVVVEAVNLHVVLQHRQNLVGFLRGPPRNQTVHGTNGLERPRWRLLGADVGLGPLAASPTACSRDATSTPGSNRRLALPAPCRPERALASSASVAASILLLPVSVATEARSASSTLARTNCRSL